MPLDKDIIELTGKIKSVWGSEKSSGNPIACASEIEAIESDVAAGKSYWDITKEQFNRKQKGENACLTCERSYVEAKSALASVGNRYTGLVRPEDIRIEAIAAEVREQAARELFRADQERKRLEANCDVKLTRVKDRIKRMKPLAHVGRWDEFMENQRQLLTDFEQDIKDIMPKLEVRIPSYAVPRPEVTSEYEEIKASLTEEELKRLEEREAEQRRVKLGAVPKGWKAYKCPYCEDDRRFETIIEMHEHIRQDHPERIR